MPCVHSSQTSLPGAHIHHSTNTIIKYYRNFKKKSNTSQSFYKFRLYLSKIRIQCHQNVEGEGRALFLKLDEGEIKEILKKKFGKRIINQEARRPGDILVLDYDNITKHPVNIKTSLGGTDNCLVNQGIVNLFLI